MKDVLVYTELGQLKSIKENNVIEVTFSDEDKIKLNNYYKYSKMVYCLCMNKLQMLAKGL